MLAWLAAGMEVASKDEHWAKTFFIGLEYDFRFLCRLSLLEEPHHGRTLLSFEHPPGGDAALYEIEPVTLDKLLPAERFMN
jgi:hypothetical protein